MLLSHSSKEKNVFNVANIVKKTFAFQRVEVQWYKMKSIPMWIGVFSQDTARTITITSWDKLHFIPKF